MTGELAVDPSNGSSTGLLDPREHAWSRRSVRGVRRRPGSARHRFGARTPCSARCSAGCARRPGSRPRRWSCSAPATRWRRRSARAWSSRASVCDVLGTAEPVCAVVGEPAHDPTGVVELHPHADPDTWLLENPGWLSGGAYRWFRDELGGLEAVRATESGADVYELLNALAETRAAGRRRRARGCRRSRARWRRSGTPTRAPAGSASPPSHGRAHLARALLEGNAHALRDVIEAIAGAGHAPSEVVCVGGGAHGRLLLELRAHVTGLPVCRPEDVETTARGAAMLAAAGAGLHPTRGRRRARDGRARARSQVQPDPELRGVYDDLHRAAPAALRRAAAAVRRGRCVGGEQPCNAALAPPARARGGGVGRARRAHRRRRHHRRGRGARRRHARPARRRSSRRATSPPGTSSASSKLIHGGLRYLEMGDIGLVREALRERELLLTRLAPHLVKPVPFLWPLRGRGWERALPRRRARALRQHRRRALGAAPPPPQPPRRAGGGAGAARRTRSSARCSSTTRSRTTRGWSPSSRGRPPRTARTSPRACASPASAGRARSRRSTRRRGRRSCCAPATSRAPPAPGPTACASSPAGARRGATSTRRASTSSSPRERIPMETGVLARTEKSVLFVIPWQGGWLIGDTDTPWSGGADQPVATAPTSTTCSPRPNALLAEPLRRDDVHGVTVGLRPLVAEAARSRHDAHQPPARGRVAGARADHDRGRQVHDLPRDGRRPDRRGGAGRCGVPRPRR